MKFLLDKEKALKLAEELGINLEFGVENPGIYLKDTGELIPWDNLDFICDLDYTKD